MLSLIHMSLVYLTHEQVSSTFGGKIVGSHGRLLLLACFGPLSQLATKELLGLNPLELRILLFESILTPSFSCSPPNQVYLAVSGGSKAGSALYQQHLPFMNPCTSPEMPFRTVPVLHWPVARVS